MGFKGKVLVVDDDEDLVQLVSYALAHAGYEAFTAVRGDEGAFAAASGGFDLVLLDLMLPGLDGLSALKEIKKAAPGTEVVMLTAHSSVETAVECMRAGAFDYIRKPFRIEDLEAVAGRAVEKRRLAQVARAALAAGGPNGLTEAITSSVLSLLGAEEALILGEKGAEMLAGPGPAAGWSPEERLEFCRRGVGLLASAGGEPVAVCPGGDPNFSGLAGAGAAAAALFIPLSGEGLLCALRGAGLPHFGEAELRRAKTLGPLVSLALKNADLNARLREVRVQLAQTQKLESLGLLAGQISHDFNNLLSVITGSVQLLMENMRPGTGLKLSEGILRMAKEGEGLIRQLLLFARKEDGPASPLDLNAAVDEVKLIIAMMAGKEVPVEYRQDPGLPRARVRSGHFKQVVLNLASNAGKASAGRGKISITSRRGLAGEDAPAGLKPEDCAVLEVADEGPGITPEHLDKIFEPFFTTRQAGNGTGLGLNIVRSAVKEAGGDILAFNRPGGGAVFRVFLPACEA